MKDFGEGMIWGGVTLVFIGLFIWVLVVVGKVIGFPMALCAAGSMAALSGSILTKAAKAKNEQKTP